MVIACCCWSCFLTFTPYGRGLSCWCFTQTASNIFTSKVSSDENSAGSQHPHLSQLNRVDASRICLQIRIYLQTNGNEKLLQPSTNTQKLYQNQKEKFITYLLKILNNSITFHILMNLWTNKQKYLITILLCSLQTAYLSSFVL